MILVFSGYMLVYASVAKGGLFALEPWAGLFADAYSTTLTQSQADSGVSPTPAASAPNVGTAATPGNTSVGPTPPRVINVNPLVPFSTVPIIGDLTHGTLK
jgi:hypothetical protein